jgi:AcrR family transcriptional regulator
MSSSVAAPRRTLTERQADTVARLVEATVLELRSRPAERVTVRQVAARAGVSPATAYTYFASRDHLVAEVFWQRLRVLPPPEDAPGSPVERVAAALGAIATLVADEPELAAACTAALLADDAEVVRLRDAIGLEVADRIRRAHPGGVDDARLGVLALVFSGAMLQAGMGHLDYRELPDRLAVATHLVLTRETS